MGALRQLEELDLSFNRLRRLPEALGRLQRLRSLDVDHNELPAFPAPLLELGALEELDCSGNRQLRVLPEGIAALHRIKINLICCKIIFAFVPPFLAVWSIFVPQGRVFP
uniref:Uncharacterized protein n=1 Tax=Chelonoidis abingdonii TaxID=106734 RepID=A0A8C0J4K1_CHEAB